VKNPLYNRKHIIEYLLYGLFAAIVYIIPVLFFLKDSRYENFYYLYIGNALFAGMITWHAFQLLYRPYDGKRSVTMLVAGNLTVLTGILICCIFIWIAMFMYSPELFSKTATANILRDAPPTIQPHMPAQLSFMLMLNAIVVNFGTGAFVSVIMSYAGKRNQTKDKPTPLNKQVPPAQN
jgi:multisubunit Na+/H+ antiporter MnhC subunit